LRRAAFRFARYLSAATILRFEKNPVIPITKKSTATMVAELLNDERQLEEFMTEPSSEVVEAVRKMRGDLMVFGAGGKMGPTLARLAKAAVTKAGSDMEVFAVSRFSNGATKRSLMDSGITAISSDLLESSLGQLPQVENVIYMAGAKFGTVGNEANTWATNVFLPGLIAKKFSNARIVVFSTGNVYPLSDCKTCGCSEQTLPAPIGEYAQSALGRERIFEHFSRRLRARVVLLRLNYAIDMRYGVLLDIAHRVFRKQPIDVTMGYVNVIWQGDANAIALRSLQLAQSPPLIMNLTGEAMISVRQVAESFAEMFGVEPLFVGTEAETALLSDASKCWQMFGRPTVSMEEMIKWTAHWVKIGGATLGKPTHYEQREGHF
jgi:nucleoside-diphosphate-sugar epimerase